MEKAIKTLQYKVMECVNTIDTLEDTILHMKSVSTDQKIIQEVDRLLLQQIEIKESCVEAIKILNQH